MITLAYDTKLETAVARGYLIGKHNAAVESSTGKRLGSRVTHEWMTRCNREKLPDLIVDPCAKGGALIRLDLCQAGLRLRDEDVEALNAEFWPVAKGKPRMAPFTAVYSHIKVDATRLESVVTRVREAVDCATKNRAVSELGNSPLSP
jgi:hypothetical protein